MACNLFDLHCAIVAALKGDATLTALIDKRVFDHVPQGSRIYPYAAIGRIDGGAFLTFDDFDGDDMIYNIDVFGKSKNFADLYKIRDAIISILSGKEDVVSTVGCCITYMLYSGTVVNPVRNMETTGRQLTVEFNIKLL